jgi:hypothetical protein
MSGLPKGFRKNVNIIKQSTGPERRQEYLDDIDYKGMYLPKGVETEDIDRTFIEFVDDEISLQVDGEEVPVLFLTIQKWAEFSKTWSFSDKYKNVKMPFITIVREPNLQVGTNQAGNWNIPGRNLYTYLKVPTNVDGRKGIDTYKIPQPTSIDINYEVRLFCNRMKDLNKFHKKIQKTFNSRQFYIKVNGHPMPIHLETIGDESQKSDFDKRRFYVQSFEMKILGYILDEDDFELIPTINRANIKFKEVLKGKTKSGFKVKQVTQNTFLYDITFKPNSSLTFDFNSDFNSQLISLRNLTNVTSVIIEVNNTEVFSGLEITNPINVGINDKIDVTITTDDSSSSSALVINGKLT